MKCPACTQTLSDHKIGDVKLDVCRQGCAGMWFDAFELKKVDEKADVKDDALPKFSPKGKPTVLDKRLCPRCETTGMRRFFTSPKKAVEIDECPQCGGIWLDHQELESIRAEYASDANRDKAAERTYEKWFGEELAKSLAAEAEKSDRRRKFARATRLILPSYWLPGKQRGGAF